MLSFLQNGFQNIQDEFDEYFGNDERIAVHIGSVKDIIPILFITNAEIVVCIDGEYSFEFDSSLKVFYVMIQIVNDLKELKTEIDNFSIKNIEISNNSINFVYNDVKRKFVVYLENIFPDKLYRMVTNKTCIVIVNDIKSLNDKYKKLFAKAKNSFYIVNKSEASDLDSSNPNPLNASVANTNVVSYEKESTKLILLNESKNINGSKLVNDNSIENEEETSDSEELEPDITNDIYENAKFLTYDSISYPKSFADIARFIKCLKKIEIELDSNCSECPVCLKLKYKTMVDICLENNDILFDDIELRLFRI
jgi:hypothetical protein